MGIGWRGGGKCVCVLCVCLSVRPSVCLCTVLYEWCAQHTWSSPARTRTSGRVSPVGLLTSTPRHAYAALPTDEHSCTPRPRMVMASCGVVWQGRESECVCVFVFVYLCICVFVFVLSSPPPPPPPLPPLGLSASLSQPPSLLSSPPSRPLPPV